jgi:hypothetical protein
MRTTKTTYLDFNIDGVADDIVLDLALLDVAGSSSSSHTEDAEYWAMACANKDDAEYWVPVVEAWRQSCASADCLDAIVDVWPQGLA